MSDDKGINEQGNKSFEIKLRELKVKRQAKRQRQKMRKRGIKLFQDYCR